MIETVAGAVAAISGAQIEARSIGSFNVRIEAPEVLYAETSGDLAGTGSLRDAIIAANQAAPAHRTIILDTGTFVMQTAHVADPGSTFPFPIANHYCGAIANQTGFSDPTNGDFDITGSMTIVGNQNDLIVIDGRGIDRVFKVHPNASLELQRIAVTGGVSPPDQGGGGILSAGNLTLVNSVVRGNRALGASDAAPIRRG